MRPGDRLLSSLGRLGRSVLIAEFLLSSLALRAEEVPPYAAPPPVPYRETLSKLLTPVEEILKKEADYSHIQGDGITLLDEVLTYVNENGSRVSVYHTVSKALTDAGVKSMAQTSFTYKKNFQHAYLISAQTLQPDGTRNPVQNDAVFIKTPQNEAADSIYNDQLELITIFSNIKPGSITERIVVLEDIAPKIPGQYSQVYTWSESWPEYRQRLVIDLPETYAKRLKITNLGQDVPAPATAPSAPQRQRMTWEKLNTPGDPWTETQAPAYQTGPLVWLSTLESWDAFAAWYRGLVQGTDTLSPELKAKIDDWTREAKSPDAVLGILYRHAARDIRYTAFELGDSDFQPHNVMSVWERQYGDCKDKANLLRAMLAYKGIPSWLTLLTTEHAGIVNKANPDYRQFNHCILAVQTGKTPVICDPTITYGTPGLLSGSEADRDLLLLKDGKAEGSTPRPSATRRSPTPST